MHFSFYSCQAKKILPVVLVLLSSPAVAQLGSTSRSLSEQGWEMAFQTSAGQSQHGNPPAQPGSMSAPASLAAGGIDGTVLDIDQAPVAGATVTLQGPTPSDNRTLTTSETGFFTFKDLQPGVSYQVSVTAKDFAKWTSGNIVLQPGQYTFVPEIKLKVAKALTTVNVGYSQTEIATQQVKIQEQQRIFGFIPNFYVVYDKNNAVPLTPKLKFRLALRTSIDPVTVGGVAFFAGVFQAADHPDFQQGWAGYGQRFGTIAADSFTDIMIGGAILPSLLHQDPRYFYQGTGTTKSRMLHALSNPFVCKGDNGRMQPNYSTMGGDLASSAISNLYYPQSNRGVGSTFQGFAISTAERMVISVLQEFVIPKFTHRAKVVGQAP